MTIRVFASGQSNSLGRGTGGPAFSGVSASVRVWDTINPLGALGTSWVTAAVAQAGGTFENTDRNNAAVWLCDQIARTVFDDVDLTLVARGGTAISQWAPGAPVPMLDQCLDVWSATGQGPAHVMVWQQGEGDHISTPADSYMEQFLALLGNLQAGGVIDTSTIVIVSGIAPTDAGRYAYNANALYALQMKDPRCFYSSTYLAATSDNVHFTGPALYDMGHSRMFSAYTYARLRQ